MNKQRKAVWILWLPVLGAFLLLIINPETAASGVRRGLRLCRNSVLPALYPFLVVTGLLLRLPGTGYSFPGLRKCFRQYTRLPDGALPVLLLGLVSGYPVGAAAAVQQYAAGVLTKEDAERILPLTNYCGPGFLLGVAGVQVFENRILALHLLILQIFCAFWFLVLWGIGRPVPAEMPFSAQPHTFSLPKALTEAVSVGGVTVLRVCAYVVFFSAITEFLPDIPLLCGIIELSAGLSRFQGTDPKTVAAAAFLMGFGGLSVACQVLSAAQSGELSGSGYLLPKTIFALLFSGCAILLCFSLWFLFLPLICCFFTRKIADKVEKRRETGYNAHRGDEKCCFAKK